VKRLGVNIDHIATLRNARGEFHPDPVYAAKFIKKLGVDSITIHLREDRRHIKDIDAKRICSIKNLLVKQIFSKVRWRESIEFMSNSGINTFIEVGPGKVLTGLIKRIDKNVKTNTINNESDIKDLKL